MRNHHLLIFCLLPPLGLFNAKNFSQLSWPYFMWFVNFFGFSFLPLLYSLSINILSGDSSFFQLKLSNSLLYLLLLFGNRLDWDWDTCFKQVGQLSKLLFMIFIEIKMGLRTRSSKIHIFILVNLEFFHSLLNRLDFMLMPNILTFINLGSKYNDGFLWNFSKDLSNLCKNDRKF